MGDNNGITFRELCQRFCCPPWPSTIVSKNSFFPPKPTYNFELQENGLKYSLNIIEDIGWEITEEIEKPIDGLFAETSRGNKLACIFTHVYNSTYTILYSHGNSSDLGMLSKFFCKLGTETGCNVFSYDYSGYGLSSGTPSEKNIYSDIDAAFYALQANYDIKPGDMILYGQSIGTVPTVDLASRCKMAGVILEAPLKSGMEVVCPNWRSADRLFNFFPRYDPSIDKVGKITSPTLVIHGTDDEIINISHGYDIVNNCPGAVEPLWVKGGGHSNIPTHFEDEFYERVKRFISIDMTNNQYSKVYFI